MPDSATSPQEGLRKDPPAIKNARRLTLLGLFGSLCIYVLSFWAWSRWLPAKQGVSPDGSCCYTFVANDPDWEHALFAFYYPLIKLDQAILGTQHEFDIVYL